MLKKIICTFFVFVYSFSFSIVFHNDYLDPGLVEKSGTFNLSRYLHANYLMGYLSIGTDGFEEEGARIHAYYAPEELKGFFLNADFYMSKISLRSLSGDAETWWGGNIPFFGETYFGFQSKIFDFTFGFQNLKSSDTIYHNLMLDDNSGSFFAYTSNLMITPFFDFQVVYNFIRFHESPWYNGESGYEWANATEQNILHLPKDQVGSGYVMPKYGKSLYYHKMNIRPAPWIRFGLFESVYFLGENFNPFFANPFFIYFAMAMIGDNLIQKYGIVKQVYNSSDIKIGFDFSVGFDGWKVYGEMMIDDANGEYVKFLQPDHPDRVGFVIGGELRGYLFDKYFRLPKIYSFIFGNLYINTEFAAVSRFTYSRDHMYNYEYVREEYPYKYFPKTFKDAKNSDDKLLYPDYVEYRNRDRERVQRIGNFIGYMYGNNADSFDIAIGWRNDLFNVTETSTNYITDRYYESERKKKNFNRLLKIQLHYRHYRLGDYRDVVMPYYLNQHFYYDLDPYTDLDGDGDPTNDTTALRTGFVDKVLERGNIFDVSVYSDLFRINRFVTGVESKFEIKAITTSPETKYEITNFHFTFDVAFIIGF